MDPQLFETYIRSPGSLSAPKIRPDRLQRLNPGRYDFPGKFQAKLELQPKKRVPFRVAMNAAKRLQIKIYCNESYSYM
jgi:hypothetical protein